MSLTVDCVIWSQDDERITVVSQLSPSRQRKRAEKVARKARDDTPYQAGDVFGLGMEVRRTVFPSPRHVRQDDLPGYGDAGLPVTEGPRSGRAGQIAPRLPGQADQGSDPPQPERPYLVHRAREAQ